MELNTVIQGNCLEVMGHIQEKSIDLVATDMPYATTACEWDKPVDLPRFWELIKQVLKPGGTLITTASQPFTTDLINSNRDWFRYELIWDKALPTGFLDAKRKPLKRHENILIFAAGNTTYNPIMRKGIFKKKGGSSKAEIYHNYKLINNSNDQYYPTSILEFSNGNRNKELYHPTQKLVGLYEYLIKTYSNPGELILDPFAGSGTTGIAAHNTGRNFILIEQEEKYVTTARKRIELARAQLRFDSMVG